MITFDVHVNGERIDFITVINVEKHKGKDYIYEVYREGDSSPIATVIHNREKPWWMLFKRVAEVLEEEE